MAWWFFRGIRRGVVTTRYPRRGLDGWTTGLRTPPAFRPGALTARLAEALADCCPSGALYRSEDGGALVYDVGACTTCGACLTIGSEAVAPSGALELAATDRADLVKRIPIRGGTS